MRIIVIGGAGTIGKAIVATLAGRHDVVVAGRRSGTVPVDIQSPDSVRDMFWQVGAFDALVCAAGEAHFGPFDTMSAACPVTSGSTRSARGWPPTATSSSDASTPAGSPSL